MEIGLFIVVVIVLYGVARHLDLKKQEQVDRWIDARRFDIEVSRGPWIKWRIDLTTMSARLVLNEPDNHQATDFTVSRNNAGAWFYRMTDAAYHAEFADARRRQREGGIESFGVEAELERLAKGNNWIAFAPHHATLIEANYQRMLRD